MPSDPRPAVLYVPDPVAPDQDTPPTYRLRRALVTVTALAAGVALAWALFPALRTPLPTGTVTHDGALPGVIAGWDACTPITLLLDPAAPPWLAKATTDAAADWATATGLDITARTDTTGHTWTGVALDPVAAPGTVPVVIAAPGADPRLSGDQVAMSAPTGASGIITAGFIVIGDHLAHPDATITQARVLARAVLRHELGHVLGLAHSDTPLMRPAPDLDAPITSEDLAVVQALTRPCVR